MSARIYMDQSGDGRTIRYNVDKTTRAVAYEYQAAMLENEMIEVPNEEGGGEPIFINPDKVVSITPIKEDSE